MASVHYLDTDIRPFARSTTFGLCSTPGRPECRRERVSGRTAPRGLQLLDDGKLLSSHRVQKFSVIRTTPKRSEGREPPNLTGPCMTDLAGTDCIKEAAIPHSSSFQCWAIRPRRPPLAVPPLELRAVCLTSHRKHSRKLLFSLEPADAPEFAAHHRARSAPDRGW
jgi:hypothetical protein